MTPDNEPRNCSPLCAEHGGCPGPYCITPQDQAKVAILAVLEYADRLQALGLGDVMVHVLGVDREVLDLVDGAEKATFMPSGERIAYKYAKSPDGVSVSFQRRDTTLRSVS